MISQTQQLLMLTVWYVLFPDAERKRKLNPFEWFFLFPEWRQENLFMLLCVILLVSRREEKIDALVCDPFCSRTRRENPVWCFYVLYLLFLDAFASRRGEKNWCFFCSRTHREKTFAVLVCDHLCSQTREKKNSLMLLCVIFFVPRPEKTLLMLLCVIFFVSRRGEKK